MNILTKGFITLLLIIAIVATVDAKEPQKILMIVSGYGQGSGDIKPGYEFDEFASAYLVFKNNGIIVDVASPDGGAVEADRFDPKSPKNALILADKTAMTKIKNTLPLSDIKLMDYAGIFIVGGKGAMFDLPNNQTLQSIIAEMYTQGKVISAVCHGPAALINVRLSNGNYLVKGKKINGFTNTEEHLFGKKWMLHFDFLLEDKLKERGGKFQSSPLMLSHVATDGNLITGQNPTSTPEVAEAVVRALGIEPALREPLGDESTLALIAKILSGKLSEIEKLKRNRMNYNTDLAIMYGYYYAQVATTKDALQMSIQLMTLMSQTSAHPKLQLQLAKSYLKLNEIVKAKKVLAEITKKHPNFIPAQKVIKSLKKDK
ncbi:MAG: DJ-1/PfpI family protein [Gammaproteobacteria bacterium]|nr:DJ-1/PfpI family protein [Gammaproteobacteria bacterium]